MGVEIERKFLVRDRCCLEAAHGEPCRQGYMFRNQTALARVRLIGGRGFLTVKGRPVRLARDEFEYEIPPDDAREMLKKYCGGRFIEKNRYEIRYKEMRWDVDEFLGLNAGLVVAEIELDDPFQPFEKPPWIGKEVTGDCRYNNSELVLNPYSAWASG